MSKVKTDLLDLSAKELKAIPSKEAFDYFSYVQLKPIGLEKFVPQIEEQASNSFFKKVDRRVYNFYLLSYLYAVSDWTYIKRDMWKGFIQNTSNMIKCIEKFDELKQNLEFDLGKAEVRHGDARFLDISEKVVAIITSPPYSIAVDYIKNDLHAFKYLNVDHQELIDKLVGLIGKGEERIRLYFEDMEKSFKSMYEILRPKGYCAVVIRDITYDGKRLPIARRYIDIAKGIGFDLVTVIRRPILGGFARLRYEYIIIISKTLAKIATPNPLCF